MSFEQHLARPQGRGHTPDTAHTGAAGGAACGDVVRISVAVDGDRVSDAGFDARGCGAVVAAGSAAVMLVRDAPVLEAARIGVGEIDGALGGLSAGKLHAAELVCDALHRALGAAVAADGALAPDSERTLVAVSGGVDSAVAALRCGPGAVAVTLELWADRENDAERSCCSPQAVRSARALAHGMGLPHLSVDLRDEFRADVVEPWMAAQLAGLTPNPCVRCNGRVRLDAMLDLAERLGAGRGLATGHYARVSSDGLVRTGVDERKDQSYTLAALAPESIARIRFPLGELRKDEVRRIAAEHGLAVAEKPDSQDLCFLAGTQSAQFLARHAGLASRPGAIVDRGGRTLGRHRGQHEYTVGQRRGLGIGGGEPLYVLAKDANANTVTVGRRAELEEVRTVTLRDAVIHRPGADRVKLRYRQRAVACRVAVGASVELELLEPAGAVAPGQLAALYDGDVVVGYGTIAR